MFSNSLRWRLPLTYALIALLTAVALNVILAVNLTLYFQSRERTYLFSSGAQIGGRLASLMADGAKSQGVLSWAQALAAVYRVRLRLYDVNGNEVLDTGPPGPLAIDTLSPFNFEAPSLPTPVPPESTGEGGSGPPATPELPIATPAPVLQMLGEAGVFEAVYGFDVGRRSNQVQSFDFTDPRTGRATGKLRVSEGPAYGRGIVQRVLRVGVVASAAAVLLAAGTGWLVSRQMVRPLVALKETSARMARGDFGARAEADSTDEIDELAQSFNAMADRVEATLHTLRRFVADAAHELHTPLTALRTDLDLAAGEADLAQARAYMARARVQTERLADLSADLLDLSRLEAAGMPEHTEVELGGLLRDLAETYASRAEQAGLTFELEAPDAPVRVRGHPGQLRRAVGNLMDNAIKFTPSTGTVALALTTKADRAYITVSDTGIGIPPDDVPRLFGRFHRGRNAVGYSGSGLGLAIVRTIVEQHGGSVKVESDAGATKVRLTLPLAG